MSKRSRVVALIVPQAVLFLGLGVNVAEFFLHLSGLEPLFWALMGMWLLSSLYCGYLALKKGLSAKQRLFQILPLLLTVFVAGPVLFGYIQGSYMMAHILPNMADVSRFLLYALSLASVVSLICTIGCIIGVVRSKTNVEGLMKDVDDALAKLSQNVKAVDATKGLKHDFIENIKARLALLEEGAKDDLNDKEVPAEGILSS